MLAWSPKHCIGLVALAMLLALATMPLILQIPGGLVPDDGYFYAAIARHIAIDHMSSFDGIHLTDGYHQLWEYVLAAVGFPLQFLTKDRTAYLFAFLVVDYVFLIATAWIAGRNSSERVVLFCALAGCEFLMEGHILAFLIGITAITLLQAKSKSRITASLVACALIPIARIDAALIPLGIAVGLLVAGQRARAKDVFMSTVAGVAGHFALMLALHGHLWSVSSEIKTAAAHEGNRLFTNLGQRTPTLPIPFEPQGVFVILLAVFSGAALYKQKQGPHTGVFLGLWLGTAAFTFGHLCLSDVHPWYYAPAFIGFPIVLLWTHPPRSRSAALALFGTGSVVLLAALCVKSIKSKSEARSTLAFLHEMNWLVPDQDKVFMVDGSGFVGYFSDPPVINGDGLVNNHNFAERLKRNELGPYLAETHTRYLVTNKPIRSGDPLVNIGGLRVVRSQATPVLSKAGNGNYFFTNFVLWRLDPFGPSASHEQY